MGWKGSVHPSKWAWPPETVDHFDSHMRSSISLQTSEAFAVIQHAIIMHASNELPYENPQVDLIVFQE